MRSRCTLKTEQSASKCEMVKYWVKLQYIIVEGKTHKMNQVIRTKDQNLAGGISRPAAETKPEDGGIP